MSAIHKSIHIEAPVERVYEVSTQPENLPQMWPSMVSVENVDRRPDGEQHFDWTYKMGGRTFRGHADTLDVQPNRRVVVRSEKGIASTFDWRYEAKDGTTDVTVHVDYELPGGILGKIAARLLGRTNEREAATLLRNIKQRAEESGASS